MGEADVTRHPGYLMRAQKTPLPVLTAEAFMV
ncbi:hypothetical protein S101468_02689 [Acetobacter pasteurianus subsp. pasteurianus]|uniref:Uncharacterized protein n=1 Tax=Acetobacter pasteurianus subsp. pasteurianus TaxID=481145 RepID=A0AAC9X240_ACEPA|nr:hypothetical protein S101468_02689 [Acetobacter pasteurianus subsp. pasteurianus]